MPRLAALLGSLAVLALGWIALRGGGQEPRSWRTAVPGGAGLETREQVGAGLRPRSRHLPPRRAVEEPQHAPVGAPPPRADAPPAASAVPELVPLDARVRGRVLYADGTPAHGLAVAARPAGARSKPRARARTGRDGEYVLVLPEGAAVCDLRVERGGEVRWRSGVPAGSIGVDFLLPSLGSVDLDVRAADTGKPLHGAQLLARGAGEESFQPVRRLRVGTSALQRVERPIGVHDLLVRSDATGHLPALLSSVALGAPQEAPPLQVALEPGCEVVLVLAAGQELPPCSVLLLEERLADRALRQVATVPVFEGIPGDGPTWEDAGAYRGATAHELRGVRFGPRGRARVRGLPRGRARLVAFPDEVLLEPQVVVVAAPRTEVELRWRRR